jgi:hypothetical protein
MMLGLREERATYAGDCGGDQQDRRNTVGW